VDRYELTKGDGRTRVSLSAHHMGSDLVVCIYNENAHIGAVSIGEYDRATQRASSSVITRLGHKDDMVAQKVAHLISNHTKNSVCVIVGIHIENITKDEIDQVSENTGSLINEFIC